ncbi:ComEC family competence protein [Gemmobacter lutimaris]|uniref:ComEC family competence protein n=1 Tax=Gemmobacter lutimaris TaxID=2306023 RepID=A0A398BRS9_9RHOB|nr:ComEC/Rec2 family competence protein [Gemmobacter lutimaris]RID92267.1 ComEC family competence protein [Gemmobacter lutimaris]
MRLNLSETSGALALGLLIGERRAGNKVAVRWGILGRLAEARGILFPWVPVFLGTGIGLWFALPVEPGPETYLAAAGFVGVMAVLWRFGPEVAQPLWVALACLAMGGIAAGVRAHLVAAPVLQFRYYGPVEGRIVALDRSQSDALRLTLDRVSLSDVAPGRIPHRVRIALQGPPRFDPAPGQRVQITAHLAPPGDPVEPGGFDFRRMAWFQRLGAVGYSRHPLLLLAPPAPREQWLNRLRAELSGAIQSRIRDDPGAFAAGVMTGDRTGFSREAVEDLRASSLAHLLAISGMHMAFLIGFVFALIRSGLALVPAIALRLNTKKIAAALSLPVAVFYLLLSGANVATERACIMICVMLGAVLLDRRALSLRSVAISATILLVLRPESLLTPGFQMSFAATTALVAGFGAMQGALTSGRVPRWAMPVLTLVLSSALAGVATAPFAAAHFNRIADYGLLANILTVPVMGAVVMPAGAIAALLAPFGLADLPLTLMGWGTRWILHVAHLVSGWEGAVTPVPSPGPAVLPLIALGGIWLAVGRRWFRLPGVALMALGLAFWTQTARPDLLVSPDGLLVGMMGAEGRALSVPRGASFAAQNWLENDGDLVTQEAAARRAGFSGPASERRFELAGWHGVHLRGKTAEAKLGAACATADLVIISSTVRAPPEGCNLIDLGQLQRNGALAIIPVKGRLYLQPARDTARLWHGRRAEPAIQRWLDRPRRLLAKGQ